MLPYLAAFVYLIVRDDGMAEREQRAEQELKASIDTYIRNAAGRSPAAQITEAQTLLDSVTVSQVEFEQLKAKALN